MSTISFIEILDKLPLYRRREVFNFLEFIYQKTMEEDLGELSTAELKAIKESRNTHSKKTTATISIEEVKQKIKDKIRIMI